MNSEEYPTQYHEMIDNYFDGELTREEEVLLFSSLLQNQEAREYFKQMNFLKNALSGTMEDVPLEVDEKVFDSIQKIDAKKEKKFFSHKFFPVVAYAVTIILFVISIFLFSRTNDYENKVDNLMQAVSKQNETIELLFNSLPALEVKTKPEYEIIIKTKL